MWTAIFSAFKAILPHAVEAIPAAVSTIKELLDSKKAVVVGATLAAVHAQSGDWKGQAVTGAVGLGYTLIQGALDKAKAAAK